MFCLIWSMCPFAVAVDFGKYLQTLLAVKFGHVVKWLFLMAAIRVLGTGLNAAACRNAR